MKAWHGCCAPDGYFLGHTTASRADTSATDMNVTVYQPRYEVLPRPIDYDIAGWRLTGSDPGNTRPVNADPRIFNRRPASAVQ